MKTAFQKAYACLQLLLASAPVFLLLGSSLHPDAPALLLVPPLATALCALLCHLFAGRKRLGATILSFSLLAFLYWALAKPNARMALALIPCAALLLLLMPALMRPAGYEWSPGFWYAGAGVHLLSRLAARFEALSGANALLFAAFIVYFLCMLLGLNAAGLRDGMGGARPPRRIALRNKAAVLLTAAIALLIANFGAVRAALDSTWQFIVRLFYAFLAFLGRFAPGGTQGGGQGDGGMDMSGLGEASEPSALALLLEKILRAAALVAIVAIVLFALWFLCKKLLRLLRRVLAALRAYAARMGESYEDTVESLFDMGEMAKAAREKAKKLFARRVKPLPWAQLDARARVRRAFSRLQARKPDAPSSRTARELLSGGMLRVDPSAAERMADIYDLARYSSAEIQEKDAAFMREQSGA